MTTYMKEQLKDFSIEELFGLLETRQEEITPDIMDLLLSFADFEAFKEQMLGYKSMSGGLQNLSLDVCSLGPTVTSTTAATTLVTD
jgi:hypothetical protein